MEGEDGGGGGGGEVEVEVFLKGGGRGGGGGVGDGVQLGSMLLDHVGERFQAGNIPAEDFYAAVWVGGAVRVRMMRY